MTDTLTSPAVPPTFVSRRRALRTVAAVGSGGLLVSMGIAGATPALAATAADCNDGNTVDAATDSAGDIQTLLDADTAIVCLSGTFPLTSTLTFDHDLTLFGLDAAVLDGGESTQILSGSDPANLEVENISFVDGRGLVGGAIFIDGDLDVINSNFSGNESLEDGGAIYVDGSSSTPTVVITDSTFTDNATGDAVDGFGGYSGGALYVDNTSSFIGIEGSTFANNEASEFGGAVFAYGAVVESSTFEQNTAPVGGAAYSIATVAYESTFAENSAAFGGAVTGLVYAATFGSTFVGNEASSAGGAIATESGGGDYGAVISLNSTFVDNSAGDVGGAIYADYGQVAFSTFLDNEAATTDSDDFSDAIFAVGEDDTMQLGGNIFAGSRGTAQLGAGTPDTYDDLGGNVFSTSQAAESALGTPDDSTQFSQAVAAIFGSSPGLADNGGATETVALIGTSPAINAVPELAFGPTSAELSAAAEQLATAEELQAAVDDTDVDQRNEPREGLADAGAFEFGEPELGNELADTGLDANAASMLGGFAALLLGAGALIVARSRRLVRTHPND